MSHLAFPLRAARILTAALLLGACGSGAPATLRAAVEPPADASEFAAVPPRDASRDGAAPPYITLPDATFDAPAADTPDVLVYAQSGSDLFRVDPATLELSRVGPLEIPLADGKIQYLNTV